MKHLIAEVAASLPDDCPRPYLEAPLRRFTKDALVRANPTRFVTDDVVAKFARQFRTPEADARLALTRPEFSTWLLCNGNDNMTFLWRLVNQFPEDCGMASMLDYIKRFCPEELSNFYAVAHETRKAWAKEAITLRMSEDEDWLATDPDIRDELAADVAEAWHAGLKQRKAQNTFRMFEDKRVSKMTQPALLKWLSSGEVDYWTIGRYAPQLQGKYATKLRALFTDDQWNDIELKGACQHDAEWTAKFAKCESPELYGQS